MPATSQQQQKLFGLALSVKRGEIPRSEVSDEVLNIVDTMSEKKIKDFAETSHNGLPTKVETVIRGLVRETFRNKVLGEISATQRANTFFKVNTDGYNIYNILKGKWDRKKVENYFNSLVGSNDRNVGYGSWFDKLKLTANSVGVDAYKYASDKKGLINAIIDNIEEIYKINIKLKIGNKVGLPENLNNSIIETEQLDEKLITFSNRAPYGQVVFIAGGAGSGKGFAVSNFLDSAGFKVRDVDEMKKQLQRLNALGKLSIQQIVDKFGKNIKPADLEGIKKIQNDGFDLKTMDLKRPDHVYALHILVKAAGN